MNQHPYSVHFFQKTTSKHFMKVSLLAMLGLAVLMTTFGMNITATHAQTSNPQRSSDTSAINIINEVFGADAPAARHIAMCESTMNPNATNSIAIGGSHAAGLFQILYPSTWNSTSQAGKSPYDARANTIAAHEIFMRDGHSWREWACHA